MTGELMSSEVGMRVGRSMRVWSGRMLLPLLALGVASTASAMQTGAGGGLERPLRTGKGWQLFEVDSVLAHRGVGSTFFAGLVDQNLFSAGLVHVPAGATIPRRVDDLPALYYVIRGAGTMRIDGTDRTIGPNHAVYLAAGGGFELPHVTDAVDILVIRYRLQEGTGVSPTTIHAPDRVFAGQTPTRNVWNPFNRVPETVTGMYLLPQGLGGDRRLVHQWDEINLVVGGHSQFTMDNDTIPIGPGSIMWVDMGVGHWFHTLDGDMQILIAWDNRAGKALVRPPG